MNKILAKRRLAENVTEYVFEAADISRHARAGQFVIMRVNGEGERIPFTICDYDAAKGTVTLLVQEVGYSTILLSTLAVGDSVSDLVGPLGNATELDGYKNIVLVGGGIGTAVIYPQAKHLAAIGLAPDVIVGARNQSLLMYEEEFKKCTSNLYLTTDDGSNGRKGFVTEVLRELLPIKKYDLVFAVGPMPMMRAVSALCGEFGVKVVVSMNSIMVDGTGMCGGCRLTVGGETKYACVHGPEFDGALVDWDEAISRSRAYGEFEREHKCRLTKN